MAEATKHTITVDLDMFDKTPEEKTAHANEIAREFGVGEDALAAVEDFKKELTKHNAWDLPFMGYVNEDGYGYAYVPNAAITTTPYWDAHAAFLALPKDAQTAFAIRMLFTHRPVDRYGADMFLHYQRGISTNFLPVWQHEAHALLKRPPVPALPQMSEFMHEYILKKLRIHESEL